MYPGRRRSQQRNAAAAAGYPAPPQSSHADFARQTEHLIRAEVRMISGCHSEQTSADVTNTASVAQLPDPAGRAGGACTSALLELLYRRQYDKSYTFQQLLLELRQSLVEKGFDQIPQLTSSRPLELQRTPFTMVGGQGTRRALLVGINYSGQSGQLSGCHNDVFNMKKYIQKVHGYLDHNITVLVDDGRHAYPTRESIILGLRQLVAQSVAGDSVYFHYSGHGGLLEPEWNAFKANQNNKEYEETLYPVDHERAGHIRDFSLFKHFVQPMPAGVTVTCVMDCCHSGSVLDLPYSFQPTAGGQIRMERNMETLSNLAFLYLLAGGVLPAGFDDIVANIESVTGTAVEAFRGLGMDEDFANGVTDGLMNTALDAYNDGGGGYDTVDDYGADRDADAYDYGDDTGGGDGSAPEMDCSCMADLITSLLNNLQQDDEEEE